MTQQPELQPELAEPIDRFAPRKAPLSYLLGILLVCSLSLNGLLGFIVHSQDNWLDRLLEVLRTSQAARQADSGAAGGIPTIDIAALRSFCKSADEGFKIPHHIANLCPSLPDE